MATLVWGSAGIVQTTSLRMYKNKLVENTIELSRIGENLETEFNMLKLDEDLISLKARDLGFLSDNEGKIIISGYKSGNSSLNVGSYYKKYNNTVDNNSQIRLFSFLMGIIAFLILTANRKNKDGRSHRSPIDI